MASDVVVDLEGAGGNPVLQENVPPVNGTTSEKRLTKVEQARREVLSAFGNCPFNSLVVKRECFKSKLKATAKNAASRKDSNRRLTRVEKARQEANEAFKNVSLGQKRKASAIEKKPGVHPVTDNAKKRLTRLERCKLEAQQAFGHVPLSTLTAGNVEKHQEQNSVEKERPRNVMKEKRKSTSKGRQNRRSTSRRRSSAKMRRRSSTKGSQLTKVQASQLEALKSFGGQSLENVWKNSKACSPVVEGVAVTDDSTCQSDRETIDMEHSGNELPTEDTSMAQVENIAIAAPQVQTHDNDMHTHEDHVQSMNGMSTIPEQSTPEASAHSATPEAVESKPPTRLEKARMESLQSFNGHAFEHVIKTSTRKMARYLTPVKHQGTNTEVNRTRDTPSQTDNSFCRRHPPPNNSFYTNLRDNSFCDRGMLLESSKMVVSTARSLDTPSPSS